MRIEVENNRTTLDEFAASLGALREPVELTRRGALVATVEAPKGAARARTKPARDKVAARGWRVLDEAHANAKKHGLSERQIVKIAVKACEEVRRDAQRSR
ncbi:MAG TPA: hypothetical protein VKX17_16760 [Planctomycetota bacterium]|nr:hypothetical protein [Planctomycetota bacterium]